MADFTLVNNINQTVCQAQSQDYLSVKIDQYHTVRDTLSGISLQYFFGGISNEHPLDMARTM